MNECQLPALLTQNLPVRIVEQIRRINIADAMSAYGEIVGAYNDYIWARSCHSAARSKASALTMGPFSAAYTTVSECLPSACLNKALARIIPKFIVQVVDKYGAAYVTRTRDPRITNAMLYRLS